MPIELPSLAYAEDALEPHIFAVCQKLHLGKYGADDTTHLGDTSTLTGATMVEGLTASRRGIATMAS